MAWLLSLHIVTLVFWCGAQLLLPMLIHGLQGGGALMLQRIRLADESMSMPRFVFTRIATPAALLAVMSGTGIFLLNHTVEVWLLLKLLLVSGLVVIHALTGWLLLRAPFLGKTSVAWRCHVLGVLAGLLMLAILWTVLAKPVAGALP